MSPRRTFHAIATPGLLLSALALASSTACAQEQQRSPFYVGASLGVNRDSNVYRTASNEVADTVTAIGLLGGIDQPFGRQRFYADATVQNNKHKTQSQLDNTSYAVTTGLDWSTVEFLSGTLKYNARRNLADFGAVGGSAVTGKNLETTQDFQATVRQGVTSTVAVDAGFEYRKLDYSGTAFANRNYTQKVGNAGVHWGRANALMLGLGGRVTKGNTPEYVPATGSTPAIADDMTRKDIDLTASWAASGFSILRARVSSTHETHSYATGADVSGATGSVAWDYKPTPRTGFVVSLNRDTGTASTFSSPTSEGALPSRVDTNTISTTTALEAKYELTSKISLAGNARYIKGKDSALNDDSTGKAATLSLTYLPTRSLSLGCNASRETRNSASGTRSYAVDLYGCSAQITLK